MAGRTVVITGPTSGLGREAAGSFARMGARLVLVGRDAGRLERTRDELVAGDARAPVSRPSSPTWRRSPRSAPPRTRSSRVEPRIDVLVDNAGAMFADREVTPEGIERRSPRWCSGRSCWSRGSGRGWRRAPTPGSWRSPRAGSTRSGCTSTTSTSRRGRTTGRAPTPARSAPRSRSSASGRGGSAARRRRQRDAPGLGRHAGPPGRAARVRGRHRRAAADRRRGRRHDRLARRRAGGTVTTGRLFLDRRVRPFDRVPATRVARRRPAGVVGRRRGTHRGAIARLTHPRVAATGALSSPDRSP